MKKFLSMLPYLYFLRFPLLIALILLLFPCIALKTAASSLLGGIFDMAGSSSLRTGGRMFFVALLALTVAWTVLETFWLVVLYAPERFAVSRLAMRWTKRQHAVVFGFLAVPTLFGAFWESTTSGQTSASPLLVGAVLGIIVALLLLWGINAATESRAKLRTDHPSQVSPGWFARQENLSVGYVSQVSGDSRLRPGHARAALLLLASVTIYIAIGIAKDFRIGWQPIVPTLAYVLLLMTLLCWALAGLAFFLDRYRVPVVVPLVILFALASLFPQSDYYYFLTNGQKQEQLPPPEVMKAGNPKRTSAIVVAASGGGIQAAAWTARVLTGLEQKGRDEVAPPYPDFAKSIRFISAVSGGSVATMYFVNEYTPEGVPDDLHMVLERAEASSLDDVAWGLLYPDLWRTIIPLFPFRHADRGDSLERAFTRGKGLSKPLADWSRDVSEGWRPAIAFNATAVDSGARFVFSTSKLGAAVSGRTDFASVYSSYDIPIVTAVRLSATFPYVSPAARPDLPSQASEPRFHVVDGGYYDDYGISTLVEWLDDALSSSDNAIQRVLIIQIRDSSPDSTTKMKKASGSFYQTFAPISTMLHVRSTGQLAHNDEDTSLIERVRFQPDVAVESAVFQYCGEKPPLSWHLTAAQKVNIDKAWNKELSANGPWRIVKNFLAGGAPLPPSATICPLTDKEEQAAN
jgi:hypothetical protein